MVIIHLNPRVRYDFLISLVTHQNEATVEHEQVSAVHLINLLDGQSHVLDYKVDRLGRYHADFACVELAVDGTREQSSRVRRQLQPLRGCEVAERRLAVQVDSVGMRDAAVAQPATAGKQSSDHDQPLVAVRAELEDAFWRLSDHAGAHGLDGGGATAPLLTHSVATEKH